MLENRTFSKSIVSLCLTRLVDDFKGNQIKELLAFNSRFWFRDLGSGLWKCSQRCFYLWLVWVEPIQCPIWLVPNLDLI